MSASDMQEFFVGCIPIAKGRPRMSRWSVRTPEKTRDFEAMLRGTLIKLGAKKVPAGVPVMVDLVFNMPIPKGTSKANVKKLLWKSHIKRPDADNIAKGVLDALNEVCWDDDGQISKMHITKRYSDEPGIDIRYRGID